MSGRRVLVIGAAGNLGLRLVARGLARGHQVSAFVSDEDVAELMMANVSEHGPFSRHRIGVALPAGERGSRNRS